MIAKYILTYVLLGTTVALILPFVEVREAMFRDINTTLEEPFMIARRICTFFFYPVITFYKLVLNWLDEEI